MTLYNTMVLPLFDYRAVVWDSCGQGSKPYLDKLNSRAALCNWGPSLRGRRKKGAPALRAYVFA